MENPILHTWNHVLLAHRADPAIVAADGQILRTFAQIEEDAARFAENLPFPPQTVVAAQVGNHPALPGLLLALWQRGCIPLLLDRGFDGPARESALALTQAAAFVTLPASALNDAPSDLQFEPRGPATPLGAPADFLKLTSGTSSAPRAIRFTGGQLLADCDSICTSMGLTPADLNFGVIPWSHSYGFSNLVTPLLCRGIPVVATEDRLPRAILNGLIHSGATVFPGLPVFYQHLGELTGGHPTKLRLCISAGAPLPQRVADQFSARFGLKVHGFYGSSECGGIAYDASPHPVPEGCVGEAMHGVDLRHSADTGRIEVRSPAVGLGYFPEPDPILAEGAFFPSDLLTHGPDGFIIAGRVSDFINIGGRKLNPVEVEQAVRQCPGVREVVVFGVPHPRRGEEPIACVAGDISIETLAAHCAKTLAAWQTPRDFWHVPAIPVNERGKCSRPALAQLYRAR